MLQFIFRARVSMKYGFVKLFELAWEKWEKCICIFDCVQFWCRCPSKSDSSTILFADILLHWIWILLCGIPPQYLGHSGWINPWTTCARIPAYCFIMVLLKVLCLFVVLNCSKSTCISEAVGKQQRWSERLQQGPWWLPYDIAPTGQKCSFWMVPKDLLPY
jgi:hypothetical protein